MKLKIILLSTVILTGLFLSAFRAPAPRAVKLQNTATVLPPVTVVVTPAVTLVPATSMVQLTPGTVPVTGGPNPLIWTIILFGLLALLAIAFLVALFSPRNPPDPMDRNPPPPPDV